MRNPAPYIQLKLVELLHPNVTYDSVVVPVFSNDEEHEDALQIVIGEYSDSDSSTKRNFQGNASQVVEIISVQHTAHKSTVDAVGELVMNLIHPTPFSNTMSGDDFQVMVLGKPSVNHLVEGSGSGRKIVRLILRWNLLVMDNNT